MLDAAADPFHRQRNSYNSGGGGKHFGALDPEMAASQPAHGLRIPQALGSGTRIGIAAIDDDRLQLTLLDTLAAHHHRGGLDLISGKERRRSSRTFAYDEREILLSFLDPAGNAGKLEAGDSDRVRARNS